MLCKRPISGALVHQSHTRQKSVPRQAKPSPNSNKSPSIFWKPSGGSTRTAERNKVIKRLKKNDGALRRHMQWLKEIQARREEKRRAKEEEVKLKEEMKREFAAKQAKKRARAVVDLKDSDDCNDQMNASMHHDNKETLDINSARSEDKRCRPAWSLTGIEAQAKVENMEQQEENDLLDFVEKLDCDSFYEDLELKVLIHQIRDRIRILEKEKNKDESKLRAVIENEMASIRSEQFNNLEFEFDEEMLKESNKYSGNEDDMRSIADSLRSCSDDTVSSIHSRKSIQVLISKAKERMANSSNLPKIHEETASYGAEVSLNYPVTITHNEDDGARLKETKSLNKLPFKNRNPAL